MAFAFLTRWWKTPSSIPLEHLQFCLFTRQGCHLCEDAMDLLQKEKAQFGFSFEIKDVDQDGQLQKQFGNCVPVVTVNGQIRFRGKVNPVLLRRLLLGESKKMTGS